MKTFNDIFKFGTDIKPKAALYCIGLLFVIGGTYLLYGYQMISIFMIFQMMVISVIISLVEYFLFINYDDLSNTKKNKNTLIWALFVNIMIIGSGWYFKWVAEFPLSIIIILIIMLELALIAFRYYIYIVNKYETKDLNEKLTKYQQKGAATK